MAGTSRTIVSPTASDEQIAEFERFLRDYRIEAADVAAPSPADRHTVSCHLTADEVRQLEDRARDMGVKRSVVLRGLIKAELAEPKAEEPAA